MTAPHLRAATPADAAGLWPIYRQIVVDGHTYPNPADTSEDDFRIAWFDEPHATVVAEANGRIIGGYKLKPMQTGRGAHVVNASYIVDASCRGQGIGRTMVLHSLQTARDLGYRAIQFNYVVSTNTGAIALYRDLGFDIVGTVPEAFDHPDQGLVATHVMYRRL
jgi:L-amino acid N-acyltransferase YncA